MIKLMELNDLTLGILNKEKKLAIFLPWITETAANMGRSRMFL